MQNNSDRDAIVDRLDTLIALIQLAFREQIADARSELLSDPICAAILEQCTDGWVDSGDLRISVAQKTGQSERTVSRRIAMLLGQLALIQTGAGSKSRYRRGRIL
jgi:hypothetical protein